MVVVGLFSSSDSSASALSAMSRHPVRGSKITSSNMNNLSVVMLSAGTQNISKSPRFPVKLCSKENQEPPQKGVPISIFYSNLTHSQCRVLSIGAGGGIRTHEPIRDRILSPAPLTTSATPALWPTGPHDLKKTPVDVESRGDRPATIDFDDLAGKIG